MRSLPSGWTTVLAKLGLRRNRIVTVRSKETRLRRLGLEQLEDRRVLASVMVSTTADVEDGIVSSIGALTTNPGADGKISLREAIAAANADTVSDSITFSSDLNGGQILLTKAKGQLNITTSMVISASALGQGITIKGEDTTPGFHNNGDGIRLFHEVDPIGWTVSGVD